MTHARARCGVDLTWLRNDSDSNPFALVADNEAEGITMQDRRQPWNRPDQYPSVLDFVNLETHVALDDRWAVDAITGYSRFDLTQKFDGGRHRPRLVAGTGSTP